MNESNKILLIGPYPPPAGGVSIHIQRLLQNQRDPRLELAVFDVGKLQFRNRRGERMNFLSGISYFFKSAIVHIHISHSLKSFIGRVIKLFGKKLIYTVHNSWSMNDRSTKKLIEISDKTILVNRNSSYHQLDIIPAYIPPQKFGEIPEILTDKLNTQKVIVSINTSPRSKSNEDDVYGFDLILDAITKINSNERILLILVDVNGAYENRYSKTVYTINNSDKVEIVYYTGTVDFPAVLRKSDLYIRATRTDGDSVANREALHLGIPVLASDVVDRPLGTKIFSSGKADELSNAIDTALKAERKSFIQKDNSELIFEVYNSLLQN